MSLYQFILLFIHLELLAPSYWEPFERSNHKSKLKGNFIRCRKPVRKKRTLVVRQIFDLWNACGERLNNNGIVLAAMTTLNVCAVHRYWALWCDALSVEFVVQKLLYENLRHPPPKLQSQPVYECMWVIARFVAMSIAVQSMSRNFRTVNASNVYSFDTLTDGQFTQWMSVRGGSFNVDNCFHASSTVPAIPLSKSNLNWGWMDPKCASGSDWKAFFKN